MKTISLALAISAGLFAGQSHAATYIVQARDLTFDTQLALQVEAAGSKLVARYPQIGVAIVEADSQFASRAMRIAALQSVTPDRVFQYEIPEFVPLGDAQAEPPGSGNDDPLFDLQWGFDAIDAQDAWAAGYRGAGVKVAVLDSGLHCAHPDLVANNLAGLNASFVAGETVCGVPAGFNHGTHVAGTIAAADNGLGVIGVAPQSKFFAVKVLSAFSGSGSFSGILQGLMYAVAQDADVVNMSLGVRGGLPVIHDTRELISAFQRAVHHARRNNTTVIAAAGNDGMNFDTARTGQGDPLMAFPAQVPGVIGISATAPVGWALNPAAANLDRKASYTNYGGRVIHFAAPGGDGAYPGNENCVVAGITRPCWVFDLVLSTSTSNSYGWAAGTSMASPHAAGVAALIIGALGGDAHPDRVELMLKRGADDRGAVGFDAIYGDGRVDAGDVHSVR